MRIVFDRQSEAGPYLGRGWAGAEEKHIWATGTQSWLMLPAQKMRGACLLSLAGWPHVRPGLLEQQRVEVMVNGYDVGHFAMSGRESLVSLVPAAAIAGKAALCIRLRHPDSARPKDFPGSNTQDARRLAVAYQELSLTELEPEVARLGEALRKALARPAALWLHTAPSVAEDRARAEAAKAVTAFQSAGDDCEFGFVQRHLDSEALGLFRFASITITDLTRGVRSGFENLATEQSLEIFQYEDPTHDYMGRESTYNLLYHTNRMPDQVTVEKLKVLEMKRLALLARKYLEDVANGAHLFVVKRKSPLLPEHVAALLAAFRTRGAGCLLWVMEADAAHPAGTAGWLAPGLIAGYVARIDVSPLQTIDMPSWISLIRSAHAVWRKGPQ